MDENKVDLDFIERLMQHIITMNIDGAILFFLPGWNIITLLQRFFEQHAVLGRSDLKTIRNFLSRQSTTLRYFAVTLSNPTH